MSHECHYPHVPECRHLITGAFIFKTDDYPDQDPHDDSLCGYCESLRACEQRVMASDEPWAKASAAANMESYDEGFAAGLAAARNAVAVAVTHRGGYHSAAEYEAVALAAIDQIITKNSGENYE